MDPEWSKLFGEAYLTFLSASLSISVFYFTLSHYLGKASRKSEKSGAKLEKDLEAFHLRGLRAEVLYKFNSLARGIPSGERASAIPVFLGAFSDGYEGRQPSCILYFQSLYDKAYEYGEISRQTERTPGRLDIRSLPSLEGILEEAVFNSARQQN